MTTNQTTPDYDQLNNKISVMKITTIKTITMLS